MQYLHAFSALLAEIITACSLPEGYSYLLPQSSLVPQPSSSDLKGVWVTNMLCFVCIVTEISPFPADSNESLRLWFGDWKEDVCTIGQRETPVDVEPRPNVSRDWTVISSLVHGCERTF